MAPATGGITDNLIGGRLLEFSCFSNSRDSIIEAAWDAFIAKCGKKHQISGLQSTQMGDLLPIALERLASATGSLAGASEAYMHNLVIEHGLVSHSSDFLVAIQHGERSLLRVSCD
ncbi:hypothetical protein VNO77_15411 [Canavalia gladiata]|uniref:Uncharacterized protein n=1 Tax=Canavalia gladiata TaxID=3824 RepID=A0AAN9LZI9_CANGL